MCARRPTSAMPKPRFLCAPPFGRSVWWWRFCGVGGGELLLDWTVTLLNSYCSGLFAFLNLRNSEVSQLNFLWSLIVNKVNSLVVHGGETHLAVCSLDTLYMSLQIFLVTDGKMRTFCHACKSYKSTSGKRNKPSTCSTIQRNLWISRPTLKYQQHWSPYFWYFWIGFSPSPSTSIKFKAVRGTSTFWFFQRYCFFVDICPMLWSSYCPAAKRWKKVSPYGVKEVKEHFLRHLHHEKHKNQEETWSVALWCIESSLRVESSWPFSPWYFFVEDLQEGSVPQKWTAKGNN